MKPAKEAARELVSKVWCGTHRLGPMDSMEPEIKYVADLLESREREAVREALKDHTLREELLWFAGRMEEKLKANDHKLTWRSCRRSDMLRRISGELTELQNAIRTRRPTDEIIDEAADVANFCMMVADLTRELAKEE